MRTVVARALVLALMLALGPALAASAAPDGTATPAPPATLSVVGWPAGVVPHVPLNFRIVAFARGLEGPRSLLVLPNGDVLVAESRGAEEGRPSANRVTLLRDSTGAGVADQRFALITDLNRPVGLALRRDRLLVGVSDALESCPFLVGQTRLHGECHSIIDLPSAAGHDRWARPIAVNADETRVVAGVGASGDATADERDRLEPARATVLSARPDGHDVRTVASGLREPLALAFEPASGRLYATVGERTLADGSRAPDFLTHLEDGGFYGWPVALLGNHEDARAAAEHSPLIAATRVPDLLLPAGSLPRGLVFYHRDQFPKDYRGAAFVALAGSAGATFDAGFKVVAVPFANGKPSGPPTDFVTGFVKDAAAGEVYGRPSAVAVATDGTLLVADESGNTVWRVIFKCAACTPDPVVPTGRPRHAH